MESSHSKLQPVGQYPARLHATKVFRELYKTSSESTLALYLEGEQTKFRNDTDRELPFRQESNFVYLSGCDIPGSRIIALCEKQDNPPEAEEDLSVKIILFIPEIDHLEVMWSGMPLTPEEVAKDLDVTEVYGMNTFAKSLAEVKAKTLHILPSYSLPADVSAGNIQTSDKHLLMACQEARLTKTPAEIDLIQLANDISSRAHEGVMKALGAGDSSSEYEASAVFSYYCAKKGAKSLAYEVIAASGTDAGTLHYIRNKKSFPSSGEGNLLLLDAGCEYQMYAADITRTFPIGNGGKFTPEAKDIYKLVEEMQDAALARMKPGCSWDKVHILMHNILAAGLFKLGILKSKDEALKAVDFGETERDDAREGRDQQRLIGEIIASGLTTAFLPHGLGHMLGLDVHDSPLASKPDGSGDDHLLKYLRYRRPLQEGNVITVEPGCYFNPFLLKPFEDSPYLDQAVLKRYMPVGGVRIEDDILITSQGTHNFTSVKRSIEDIEKLCQTKA